jgi:hypothetical protein
MQPLSRLVLPLEKGFKGKKTDSLERYLFENQRVSWMPRRNGKTSSG